MRPCLYGLLLTLAACGSRVPLSIPTSHRAVAESCATTPRPPGNCNSASPGPGSSPCTSDAQCIAGGVQGRCSVFSNAGCTCNYDSCKSDADCASNQLCACRGTFGIDNSRPSSCVASNCRTDADCGAHGYCSPSLDFGCGAFLGVVGFYCHTGQDSCMTDSDCAASSPDGGFGGVPFCAFNRETGRWACSGSFCAG